MSDQELDKYKKIENFLKEPLENGKEGNNMSPLGKRLESAVTTLLKSSDPEEILKGFETVRGFITDDKINKEHPNLIQEMKGSLKQIFEVPTASMGKPIQNNTANEVLMDNPEMTADLFKKMIDQNLTVNKNNKNELDLDISTMLMAGHLQPLSPPDKDGNITPLINSPVINQMLDREDVQKSMTSDMSTLENDDSMSSIINGFKSIDSLIVNKDLINNHFQSVIDKNKSQEDTKSELMTLNVLKTLQQKLGKQTIELEENLTPEEKAEKVEQRGNLKKSVNEMKLEGVSTLKLDTQAIKTQEQDQAEINIKNKAADNLAQAEEHQHINDSAKNQQTKFFAANRVVTTSWLEKLRSKNQSLGTNNNPFLESLGTVDKWGTPKATFATINPFNKTATIGRKFMTDPVALQSVLYRLMDKYPPKLGEQFQLHLDFRGDKALGSSYMESFINVAMNSKPPVPLDCIHVPKKFNHILEKYKEENQVLASGAPIPESDKQAREHDAEVEDLDKIEKEQLQEKERNRKQQEMGGQEGSGQEKGTIPENQNKSTNRTETSNVNTPDLAPNSAFGGSKTTPEVVSVVTALPKDSMDLNTKPDYSGVKREDLKDWRETPQNINKSEKYDGGSSHVTYSKIGQREVHFDYKGDNKEDGAKFMKEALALSQNGKIPVPPSLIIVPEKYQGLVDNLKEDYAKRDNKGLNGNIMGASYADASNISPEMQSLFTPKEEASEYLSRSALDISDNHKKEIKHNLEQRKGSAISEKDLEAEYKEVGEKRNSLWEKEFKPSLSDEALKIVEERESELKEKREGFSNKKSGLDGADEISKSLSEDTTPDAKPDKPTTQASRKRNNNGSPT